MPGWSRMPSTTSRPPFTRFTTPGGRPSESSTSNAICWVSGTCSDGFRTNVFPQPIANGRNQNGTIAGKLNGTVAAHKPTGRPHAPPVSDRLAHLGGHRAGEVLAARIESLAQLEQLPRPSDHRHVAPHRERG